MESLTLLTECVLKNNVNMRYFQHLPGTAIGTKSAQLYATLLIGYLEDKLKNLSFGEAKLMIVL